MRRQQAAGVPFRSHAGRDTFRAESCVPSGSRDSSLPGPGSDRNAPYPRPICRWPPEGGVSCAAWLGPAGFFAKLGIQTYGFLPMQRPEEMRFMELVHAEIERVPLDAVEFGTRAIRGCSSASATSRQRCAR
jgi:hypothetical protein